MNYKRIYKEFIADRRKKQKALKASGEYYETHHIKPRSLGGSDHARNLITLTAGDHYFAHLCLAKIHGGMEWFAVKVMADLATGGRDLSKFARRKMVAVARQRHAEQLSADRREHTLQSCMEVAKKYQHKIDWMNNDYASYSAAGKYRWIEKCSAHMTRPPSSKLIWTKEACVKDAKKYRTKSEWREDNSSAYSIAHRNDWLDDCCEHMADGYEARNASFTKWTFEACMVDAAKYATPVEWVKASNGAYKRAHLKGWLEQCCAHMTPARRGRVPRPVRNLDTGEVYESATEAAGSIGGRTLNKVLSGARKTAGGYHWAYVDETETTAKEG